MGKNLCEWKSKQIDKHFDELVKLVKNADFVCKKCARCANTKKVLCKPEKL